MAEPILQVERRLDRIEEAIRQLAQYLGPQYQYLQIDRILQGEKEEEETKEETE